MNKPEPGRIPFEAYNNAGASPGLTWDKRPVPTWENLTDDVRGKWNAAYVAVANSRELPRPLTMAPMMPTDGSIALEDPGQYDCIRCGFHECACDNGTRKRTPPNCFACGKSCGNSCAAMG